MTVTSIEMLSDLVAEIAARSPRERTSVRMSGQAG
jgi:hypothetical protein